MDTNILSFNTNQYVTNRKFLLSSQIICNCMLTSGIILAKMNHQLFTQTYINILAHFTNLVHCPQIHLPIFKVVDKILAAVKSF